MNTPRFVQEATNSGGTTTTVTITFSANLKPGNVVLVGAQIDAGGGGNVSTVTGGGGTWTQVATANKIEMWASDVMDEGVTQIVVTWSTSSTSMLVHGMEFAGIRADADLTTTTSDLTTTTVFSSNPPTVYSGLTVCFMRSQSPTLSSTSDANWVIKGNRLQGSTRQTAMYSLTQSASLAPNITFASNSTGYQNVCATFAPENSTRRFYLHNTVSPVEATLPASGVSGSATTPTVIGSGGGVNRLMDATIGLSQTSLTLATNATTSAQSGLIGRWVSTPLQACFLWSNAAGFIITRRAAALESNTNSNFLLTQSLYVWRPSTGARVGSEILIPGTSGTSTVNVTTETDFSLSATTSNNVTILDGDVLILELWRSSNSQVMGTSYNNQVFYDGTTEGSASSNAAFINLMQALPMQFAPPQVTSVPARYRSLVAQ